VYIFGRDKNNPEKYVGSKFAYKLNEFLEGHCDKNGYDPKIKDKESFLTKIPKINHDNSGNEPNNHSNRLFDQNGYYDQQPSGEKTTSSAYNYGQWDKS